MDALALAALVAFGFLGGFAGGMLGVGGGVLFVPALVLFAEESQLTAESTSLVAVVAVGVVGVWRQRGYGNVRLRDGLTVGALSPLGALAGVVGANSVSDRTLELAFAGVMLYFVIVFVRRAARSEAPEGVGSRP